VPFDVGPVGRLASGAGGENMSEDITSNYSGEWSRLGKQLSARTLDPFRNAAFVIFVILGPILFGALGVWVEVFRLIKTTAQPEYSSLITAINAFYPALGCSTALQLVLASASKNDKGLISFALLMLSLFPATALVLQSFSDGHPIAILTVSGLCSIMAVWLWWITNGSDPTFMTPSPDAPTGGQLDRNLPGSLSGFQA
jgi:nitrate reductase NapE component